MRIVIADVVLYARGPHLHAMQQHGLRVVSEEGEFLVTGSRGGTSDACRASSTVFGLNG
jgi:hypothetical protein